MLRYLARGEREQVIYQFLLVVQEHLLHQCRSPVWGSPLPLQAQTTSCNVKWTGRLWGRGLISVAVTWGVARLAYPVHSLVSLCCLNNTGKWELRVLFSPCSAHSAAARRLFAGAPADGIILANMERDVLKREEMELNILGDAEVGSIAAPLCFSQFNHCVLVLITERVHVKIFCHLTHNFWK